jgi:hypothetical protein
MQTPDIQLVQPSLDLTLCIDAESCSRELKRCAEEADRCCALAQAGAELAIRHASNAGAICNQAKEILPHGEFSEWLEANSSERGIHTMRKWMKLAKGDINLLLTENPTLRGLQDAYVAAGVLPMPEEKQPSEEKGRPVFTLTFKHSYAHISEWNKDAARDFLYEFERVARYAAQLKTEFGL